jgi:hypothetical protein
MGLRQELQLGEIKPFLETRRQIFESERRKMVELGFEKLFVLHRPTKPIPSSFRRKSRA